MTHEKHPASLHESPRFETPIPRRDFLGLASIWAAMAAFAAALLGLLRLPMPSVFPESNPKVKIGKPQSFPKGTVNHLSDISVWVVHDQEGLYSISSICTHLGCVAKRDESGEFLCPCHGSVFNADGKVLAGPAPTGLHWLEMSIAPDGQIVVDKTQNVSTGTRLVV